MFTFIATVLALVLITIIYKNTGRKQLERGYWKQECHAGILLWIRWQGGGRDGFLTVDRTGQFWRFQDGNPGWYERNFITYLTRSEALDFMRCLGIKVEGKNFILPDGRTFTDQDSMIFAPPSRRIHP